MARLDRLGPAKEVAQIGAAIGREFSHALLASVALRNEDRLNAALDRLIEAGLVFRQGVPPEATYLFKHALVRDAAYGTLLRQPRRDLHFRIAKAIEDEFPEIAQRRPELLAHHCMEGGLIEQAAMLWGKVGQRSLARSALVEAASQLSRALDLIGSLPGTPALRREQIKFQVELVTVLMHVKGYGAPDTKVAANHARSLIENAEARLPMLWGADQDQDLLAHFQHLGRMRAELVALRRGAMRTVLADREVFVYERTAGDETMTVALNFSNVPQHRDVAGRAIELGPFASEVKRTGLVRSQA